MNRKTDFHQKIVLFEEFLLRGMFDLWKNSGICCELFILIQPFDL